MSQIELAAYIQSSLREAGIDVVLSGGSAVSFYSSDPYVLKDLDLITTHFAKRREIRLIMGRCFPVQRYTRSLKVRSLHENKT